MSERASDDNISANIVPWLPQENFWQENLPAIGHILETTASKFPDYAPPALSASDVDHPTNELRAWMWQRFMGHQHGSQQGFGDKLPLTIDKEGHFWPDVTRLKYGPYSFVAPKPAPKDTHYDKAYILGGILPQNINRLLATLAHEPLEPRTDEIILMAGQRLRWEVPGEVDVDDIYATTARYSGVDIDRLRELSPWIKQQEDMTASTTSEWDRPYATEFDLGRLTVEAVLKDAIDWSEYPVLSLPDENPVSFPYAKNGVVTYTAPRDVSHVTYELKDGRKAHVMNGKPVPRLRGDFPKPTSDSTTREAVELIGVNPNDAILIGTSVPHVRAALDALIRILDLRGDIISKIDIATGPWEYGNELLTGLGEIPATYKADMRLRAVLQSKDPDSDELKAL